jgi:hypothetical protein
VLRLRLAVVNDSAPFPFLFTHQDISTRMPSSFGRLMDLPPGLRRRPPLSLTYAPSTGRWVIMLDTQRVSPQGMIGLQMGGLCNFSRSRYWRAEARSGADALGLVRLFVDTGIFVGHPA